MELISIIVPVYNSEKYLTECIESILNQTYKNIELILVNDGSTDGSGAICDSYALADERVKVFHKENAGVCSARNLGIEKSTGLYLMFVDSDDLIENFAIEKMFANIHENNVELCFCNRRIIGGKVCDVGSLRDAGVYSREEIIKYHLKGRFISSSCLMLAKKDKVKNCFFDLDLYSYEDWEYNFRVLMNFDKISICSEPYYIYHEVIGSASKSPINEKKLTCLLIFEKASEYIKNNSLSDSYIMYLDYFKFYILHALLTSLAIWGEASKESRVIKCFVRKNMLRLLSLKELDIKQKIHICIAATSVRLYCFIFRLLNQDKLNK